MKPIFWNVDTQFDFMRPEGKLYVQDAYKIEPNLEKLTSLAGEMNIVVVNTADWHNKNSREISDKPDWQKTFPEHCMAGSEGALTYFVAGGFESIAKNLREGKYKVEEWTRLEAEIDGNPATSATSEYFLGESKRTKMSKHILEFGGKKEKQGCSGLLVSTGAGSTGWYGSAHGCGFGGSVAFPRTADYAKFVATEPYMGRLYKYSMLEGVLKKGDELVVQSLNDNGGILESDSVDAFEFNREARAVIRISDKPLRVVNMKT